MRTASLTAALVICATVGCGGTSRHIPPVTIVSGVDLSRYSSRGFFFSTEAYSGPHETMGLVAVTSYAEMRQEKVQGAFFGTQWTIVPVSFQTLLDTVYARSVAMGADALVKMEFHSVSSPATPEHPQIPGTEITGVAIKRRAP